MASIRALQLLLCLCCVLISNCQGLESIDVLKPIAKISPAKINDDILDDHFGYSVTAHQFFTNSSGLSLEDIFNKTVVIVGAPHGKFPGGTDLEPDWRACQNSTCTLNETILMNFTPEEIDICLENITTGLVYQCSIGINECDGLLGNRDPASNDGLLFDRIGNYHHCNLQGIKDMQAMGALLYSSGEYFIACAPLWTNEDANEKYPEGRCVYSNRSLMNFNLLRPCDSAKKFCSGGVGGHIKVNENGFEPVIGIGVPSLSKFGEVYYYQGSNSSAAPVKKDSSSIFDGPDEYYGYFITSGFITNNNSKDYIVSVPRYADQNSAAGRVAVVTDVTEEPDLFIEGKQIGEYFGYSVAAVDLNGDGWDDIVVGAPFYWDTITPELGRVYVFLNDEGNLNESTIITGNVNGGRFGISVVNLGDLNNDGFEDVAISAPYEDSGVIYIYHGQQMDDMGSIINTTFQQRIEGSKIADQVTNLTSVSTFGFSLSGTTDVDQNTYRDIVVGAYESQTVFVLRSIPVAVADITITAPSDPIRLDDYNCRDPNDNPITCFVVTVCTQYRGRGLESGFSTTYKLEEVIETNQQNRLFFDPSLTTNSIIRSITFPGPNQLTCNNVTAYVKNTTVLDVNDFYLMVELLQIPRDNSSVNTKFVPFDLSDSPIIDATPSKPYNISIVLPCGDDNNCIADLTLVVTSIDYKTDDATPAVYSDRYVVGDATRVDIRVDLSNLGEDAFKSYITFVVNTDYLTFRQVVDISLNVISCTYTTVNNTTYQNYTCNIPSTISNLDAPKQITLRLMGNTAKLVGNEGTLALPIAFRIIEQQHNKENSSTLENNEVTANIVFAAVSNFEVIVLYTNVLNGSFIYTGIERNLDNLASNLGGRVNMQVTLQNKGKSKFNGLLDLYIPARGPEETYYYYYPASLSVQTPTNQSNLRCNTSSLNPDNFLTDSTARRKKRSFSDRLIRSSLSRKKRQDTSYNLDCLTNRDQCLKVSCDVKDLGIDSVSYIVTGYIDERFYNGKIDTFIFRAFVTAEVTDGFTNSAGSINKANVTLTLTKTPDTGSGDVLSILNIIIIVVCVLVAIFFIILIAIVLYFLGFFRRKQIKKEEEENADPYDDTYVPALVDIDTKDDTKERPQVFKEEPQSTKEMPLDTFKVSPSDNTETITEKVPSAPEESTI